MTLRNHKLTLGIHLECIFRMHPFVVCDVIVCQLNLNRQKVSIIMDLSGHMSSRAEASPVRDPFECLVPLRRH